MTMTHTHSLSSLSLSLTHSLSSKVDCFSCSTRRPSLQGMSPQSPHAPHHYVKGIPLPSYSEYLQMTLGIVSEIAFRTTTGKLYISTHLRYLLLDVYVCVFIVLFLRLPPPQHSPFVILLGMLFMIFTVFSMPMQTHLLMTSSLPSTARYSLAW